jgi:hypothetical protein
MSVKVQIGKMKGKAYTKEEYLFKKAHPFRWWLGNGLKEFFRWRRRVARKWQMRKEEKNGTIERTENTNK